MRRLLALSAMLLGGLSSTATSWAECEQGVWPLNGATNVPLDQVLRFGTGTDLETYPRLDDGITLTTADGVDVPFTIERGEEGFVHVTPVDGLQADTEYVLRGVDWRAMNNSHYAFSGWSSTMAESTFSTGGDRRLLAASRSWEDEALYLVFSEATTPADVEVAFDGEPIEVGQHDDHMLVIPDYGQIMADTGNLPEDTAASGTLTVDGQEALVSSVDGPHVWQGENSCW